MSSQTTKPEFKAKRRQERQAIAYMEFCHVGSCHVHCHEMHQALPVQSDATHIRYARISVMLRFRVAHKLILPKLLQFLALNGLQLQSIHIPQPPWWHSSACCVRAMPCFICSTKIQKTDWHEVPTMCIQSFTWDEMQSLHWEQCNSKWYFCICETCCEEYSITSPVEWFVVHITEHSKSRAKRG